MLSHGWCKRSPGSVFRPISVLYPAANFSDIDGRGSRRKGVHEFERDEGCGVRGAFALGCYREDGGDVLPQTLHLSRPRVTPSSLVNSTACRGWGQQYGLAMALQWRRS